MNVLDRFLNYITFDTQSDEDSCTVPSTPGQRIFAEALAGELHSIGLDDVALDKNGYVMATLPSNVPDTNRPAVGFIAHLDTSPDFSGKDVKPRIITYTGGDIVLNDKLSIILSPDVFPELNQFIGQELIVTDGTTLLGADDKAGVAAIISAIQQLKEHPEIKHGKIRIAFTPDEEIGRGANFFDVQQFGCEWAYTVDGGEIGELEYENFNAAEAKITIQGRNVHPGYAKDKMVNASLIAIELNNALPARQRPEHTEGYEGFFHLTHLSGTVEDAHLSYIIRDHSRPLFEAKKELLRSIVGQLNEKYAHCVTLKIRDQYYNMCEIVEQKKEIVELAHKAMVAVGVTPRIKPVRGGTDGARLSFEGLPCPNIFTGGLNFHGRYEFLPVRSLEKSMETIIQIIKFI
ncbi:MAG: peptidase T [Tannerella sp.]|nr:peptidase T [Tannerella sp.]